MTNKFGAKSTANEILAGIDLKTKRFFITGISSGIGLATTCALVARGAKVVGTVRNLAKAAQAIASIHTLAASAGGSLETIELDLASLQSAHRSWSASRRAKRYPTSRSDIGLGRCRSEQG